MIDVTTSDHHGHWDVEDIRRLCEYRDQLRAELHRIRNQSMEWALACPHDCPECDKLYETIKGTQHPTGDG